MTMSSWKSMLSEALKQCGDAWEDVESNTMTEADMNTEFDSGYGTSEGCAFTVWTKRRVYFPVVHDGAEWVGSVSRHPNRVPTEHQGGQ